MPGVNAFQRLHGLEENQAEKRAQRYQALLEEKEKYITFKAPGDVTLRATNSVTLSGTGTEFDQLYYIETVEHHFSIHGGYEMTVTAKNGGPSDTGYSPSSGDAPSPPVGPSQLLPSEPGFTSSEPESPGP